MPAQTQSAGRRARVLLALLTGACSAPALQHEEVAPDAPHAEPAPAAATPPAAVLPAAAGRFAPAHTELASAASAPAAGLGNHLTDVETCADCHADVAAQWATSAHAFASFNNPIYRVSIQGFRERVGARASRFCAGCHDVALLVDGAMDDARGHDAAAPETPQDDFAPDDARAHAGITCRICHGIASVRPDGNGSYTLRTEPIPLPREDDPDSLAQHRQAVRRGALGTDLCIACHRSFLGPDTGNGSHLTGMDDGTAWQASAFTGSGTGRVDDPVVRADCMDCHMPREPAHLGDAAARDGTVASHRFPGGHTWLAAMRRDPDQLAQIRERLRGAASIDIVAPVPAGAPVPADVIVDIVVRNLAVGHRFPAGVRDAQDTWIEVTVRDAAGALVAASGMDHEHDPDDTEAHVLRAHVADEDGRILHEREVDTFRAPVVDHTIGPRDVAVVRYRLDAPAPGGLEVHARLRHRSRNLRLQAAACAEARAARGRAFDQGAAHWRGMALDPCAPQPVTTIAEQRITLGDQLAGPDAWRRHYEHGLGWLHAAQDHADQAGPSLRAALALLETDDASQTRDAARLARAMVLTALGTLAGRQGRTGEALAWLDRAAALMPDHAAIQASRGAALARVWRWHDAVAPLRAAAARAPLNRRAQALLAMALGSVGEDARIHAQALEAAQRGLALNPRDEALLRAQSLALAALGAPDADAALAAYDRFRAPDRIMNIRFACAARDAACAREREPVHEHALTPAARPRAP